MTTRQTHLSMILLVAAAMAEATPQTDERKKVKSICHELQYLNLLKGKLSNKLPTSSPAISELTTLSKIWTLHAAQTNSHARRCLLLALARKAEEDLQKLKGNRQSANIPITEALELITKHIGYVEATKQAAAMNVGHDDGQTTAPSRSSSVELNFKVVAGGDAGCELDGKGKATPHPFDDIDIDKITHLKLTDAAKLGAMMKITKLTGSSLSSGCPNGGSVTNIASRLASCQVGAGASWSWTPAASDTAAAQTETSVFKEDERTTSSEEAHNKVTETSPTREKLAQKICFALKAAAPKPASMKNFKGSTLAADKTIRRIVRNCNPDFHELDDINDDQKARKLVEYITTAYGDDVNDFVRNFITKLEEDKVASRLDAKPENKRVNDLISAANMASTLSHLEGLRIKKELEGGKKNTVATPATDLAKKAIDCKGEKDETKCNEKDGCEYKDWECKAKVTTTAGGTDGKTNTTGSNSFVISKGPLLLAVLFL
ncbi:variant surface glycoprotein (VSG) [Trypanosoma brucei equiperdum]|uniref:Variant surface glycoprotein (VSG) n=1 Tax=Trypanosoma brucei equiperdum TaxID=630700 RepID=A0A3L6KU15_9TRYP|nr:variant surface glycoprotein (VSG) [Trypanosoma brucei equiperdum]